MRLSESGLPRTAAEIDRQAKVNLTFIWFGVFVGLLGANFVFPFVPFYVQDLGVTEKSQIALWTSLSGSATGVSLFLTAPLWGAMADRFGRKPMFVRALIGAGIAILFMGLVTQAWQFVGLRLVMGAFAGTMGAAAALVAATTPRERVGQALGTLQTAQFSANMLGPFIGGEVAQTVGLRESFYVCAALYLVAGVLVYVFVKERAIEGYGARQDGDEPRPSLADNLRVVLGQRQILVMLGLLFALWLSTTLVRPLMPISIDDFSVQDSAGQHVDLHIGFATFAIGEKRASSYVFAAIGLTSTLAAFTVGRIAAKTGYRRSVAVASLATGVLFIPVALAPAYGPFLFFMGLTGLFQGAMVPGMNALLASSTPEGKQGSAFGLAASMQSLALIIGPLLGGAIIAAVGIRWDYALVAGVLLLAGLATVALVKEPGPPRTIESLKS
ncbi:MAG: MFS transporter [Dehalococcoidia bacterium]